MYGIFDLMCAIRKKDFDKIRQGDVKSQNLKKKKKHKKKKLISAQGRLTIAAKNTHPYFCTLAGSIHQPKEI